MLSHTNNFSDIHIEHDTIYLDIFTKWSGKKVISVAKDVHLTYLVLMQDIVELDLSFVSSGESASMEVKWLLLWKEWWNLTLKAHAHLKHDHAAADLHLVTLLQDKAVAEVDGWVDLHPDVAKVAGHLLEENIILWDTVRIKTLPMLDVRSSDVSASHGCRIERLDSKKMFYLQSRWLDTTQAKHLMIAWYIEQMFVDMKAWADEQMLPMLEALERDALQYILH